MVGNVLKTWEVLSKRRRTLLSSVSLVWTTKCKEADNEVLLPKMEKYLSIIPKTMHPKYEVNRWYYTSSGSPFK